MLQTQVTLLLMERMAQFIAQGIADTPDSFSADVFRTPFRMGEEFGQRYELTEDYKCRYVGVIFTSDGEVRERNAKAILYYCTTGYDEEPEGPDWAWRQEVDISFASEASSAYAMTRVSADVMNYLANGLVPNRDIQQLN